MRFKLLIAFAIALLLVVSTRMITGLGDWYSNDIIFTAQVDAILNGHFALSDRPIGTRWDLVWGEGLQAAFGLGVPFLMVPFTLLWRIFGISHAPINLVYLFCLAFAIWRCLEVFPKLVPSLSPRFRYAFGFLGVCVFFFNGLLYLQAVRFGVYAQPFGFAYVLTVILITLLLDNELTPSRKKIICIAVLCGALPLFRAPYAVMSVASLVFVWRRMSWSSWLLASLGPALLLITNQLRFGSMFEFGYAQSILSGPMNIYQTRFGSFITPQYWLSSVKALLGTLFFNQRLASDIPRMMEMRYFVFGWMEFVLLIASMMAVYKSCRISRRFIAWGLACFTMLFVYYTSFFAWADRYFIDFLPAFSVIVFFGFISAVHRTNEKWRTFMVGIGILIFVGRLVLVYPAQVKELRIRERAANAVSFETMESEINRFKTELAAFPDHIAPNSYSCPSIEDPSQKIGGMAAQWDIQKRCKVRGITQVFLPPSPCVSIDVEYESGMHYRLAGPPRMKSGLIEYPLQGGTTIGENRVVFRFCGEGRNGTWGNLITIALVTPSLMWANEDGVMLRRVAVD